MKKIALVLRATPSVADYSPSMPNPPDIDAALTLVAREWCQADYNIKFTPFAEKAISGKSSQNKSERAFADSAELWRRKIEAEAVAAGLEKGCAQIAKDLPPGMMQKK
jgi:hypothetical protein